MIVSRTLSERTATLTLFAAGFAIVFRRWLLSGFDATLGDDGDGVIFLAIIAHWDLVYAGGAHWSNPSFFYPEPGALGFTDSLFLYGLAHAGLRALGFDLFHAFMLEMATLSAIGFFGFLHLARRHFALPTAAAAVGATLFAFANMNAVGLVHAQKYTVMLLPVLCDLALTAWNERAQRRAAALAAAAGLLHALIFFTAYQTGWFFTFFMLLIALVHPGVFGLAASLALIREAQAKAGRIFAYAAGFALGIVPFAVIYLPVLLAGRHRDLTEIYSHAPYASDILNLTVDNWMWGDVLQKLGIAGRADRPWHEVDLGYTPVVFALLLVVTIALLGAAWRRTNAITTQERWLLVLALTAFLSVLIQLEYFGIRPWSSIWALVPGAGGIRYTFRSQLVANLFASLCVAYGFAWLWAKTRTNGARHILVVCAALFVVAEQINRVWPATISRNATTGWIAAIPPAPSSCRVFYIAPNTDADAPAGWRQQVQAMLLSQVRGMPTLNGYSSWLPEHWDLEEPGKPGYPAAVRDWVARHRISQDLCGLDLKRGHWSEGLP